MAKAKTQKTGNTPQKKKGNYRTVDRQKVTKEIALSPKTPPKERKTHKLEGKHIQLILDMTLSGYTNDEILKELKTEHGVVIHVTTLLYHKRQNSEKLVVAEEEQIRYASARSPYMQLAARIALIERAITREEKKKTPSNFVIATLANQLDVAVKNMESIRIKKGEIARRAGANNGEVAHDEYVKDMERRAKAIETVESVEYEIMESGAGEELVVDATPIEPESPPVPVVDIEEESISDQIDREMEELDESDLIQD